MFKIFSIIGQIIISIIILYIVGVVFNFMPEKYSPNSLYTGFKTTLANDAVSKSSTSKISAYLSETIANMEKSYKAKKEADAKQEEIERAEAEKNSPINKAKEAVQNLENSMQKQKEQLDAL